MRRVRKFLDSIDIENEDIKKGGIHEDAVVGLETAVRFHWTKRGTNVSITGSLTVSTLHKFWFKFMHTRLICQEISPNRKAFMLGSLFKEVSLLSHVHAQEAIGLVCVSAQKSEDSGIEVVMNFHQIVRSIEKPSPVCDLKLSTPILASPIHNNIT